MHVDNVEMDWLAKVLDQPGSPSFVDRGGHTSLELFVQEADGLPEGERERVLWAVALAMVEANGGEVA